MAIDEEQTYYQKWYAKNREARNERRRALYDSDDDFRTREIERRTEYEKRKAGTVIPTGGRLYRTYGNKEVEVYRIGEVAAWADTSPQIIHKYEKAGLLPAPLFSGTHRLYTDRQCELIHELAEFMRGHRWASQRGEDAEKEKALMELKKQIKKDWTT